MKLINQISKFVATGTFYLSSFLLVVMTIIIFCQGALRYILNAPIGWAEGLAKVLLLAISLLCASYIITGYGHVKITLLTERLPKKINKMLLIITDIISLAMMGSITYYSFLSLETMPGVLWDFGGLPKAYVFAILPFCFIIITFQTFAKLLQEICDSKVD